MELILHDLYKRLGGRAVLDGVSLRCAPGEILVVRGQNGSGKSTLLRLIAGILVADAGRLQLGGQRLDGDGAAARRHLGYVPDASEPLPELLVEEFLRLVASLKGVPHATDAKDPRFCALRDQLAVSDLMRRRLPALSFGQRKRACLLAALLGDPHLLLCDEPSDGLDPDGVAAVLALLRERAGRGLTAVLTTNDLSFARAVGGTTYLLRSGKLDRIDPGFVTAAPTS